MGGGQESSGQGRRLGPVTNVMAPCSLGFWGPVAVVGAGLCGGPRHPGVAAEKIASEKLGRRVTVGQVDFKPWSLELTLKGLAIAKSSTAGAPAAGNPRQRPVWCSASADGQAYLYRD